MLVAEIHKIPVYGKQSNQSCGQGFMRQNSCGQGFLGQTGFQNPNQVMPGFQNLVNQGAGNFGFAVPGNGFSTRQWKLRAWKWQHGLQPRE